MSIIYPFEPKSTRPHQAKTSPLGVYGITGRDSFILAESLIRYIATEQAKPDHEQSWSNLQDARAIFNAYIGRENVVFFGDQYPGLSIDLTDEKAPRNHSD